MPTFPRLRYPTIRASPAVDVLHGETVPDPWRTLEDSEHPETKAWIEAQNALTRSVLDGLPRRDEIRGLLHRWWNYERFSAPEHRGGRWFFTRNDGLQNQSVLYAADAPDAPGRVLLDPNTLSGDGTCALTGWEVSPDGRRVAFGLSEAGSDWTTWHVLDVETGERLPDELRWIKFTAPAWTADGSAFFYGRYDPPAAGRAGTSVNAMHRLFLHRIGTPQSDDELVYERPDKPDWMFQPRVSDDGRWLVFTAHAGTGPKNLVFARDLQTPGAPIVAVVDEWKAEFTLLGTDDDTAYFKTNLGVARGRIVACTLGAGAAFREVVPEAGETLVSAHYAHRSFVCVYLRHAHSEIRRFAADGAPLSAPRVPGIGSVEGFTGASGDRETYYTFQGFTTPATIFRLDLETGLSTVWRRPDVSFDPDTFVTTQEFAVSADGTRVPVFISRRRDTRLDGKNPCYVYGYGGFGISLTPVFSVPALVWMACGGVYAVPNLRGGGEYGDEWHRAGTRERKNNTFDDLYAVARHLVRKRYTTNARMAAGGGSNGGLLVGAAIARRPGLFGAALPSVGVLDMLRFHKFTIGWAWVDDYGSPDDPAMYPVLRSYSPLHNLRTGMRYPAVLVTTADHDDRVVPAHSYKFTAALQAAQAGDAPILIRIETRAGHGAGKPISKLIEEAVDKWSFLLWSAACRTARQAEGEPGGAPYG